MSNLFDLPGGLTSSCGISRGRVVRIAEDGGVDVRFGPQAVDVDCAVLRASCFDMPLAEDDEVLVWCGDAGGAVVLGRVGRLCGSTRPVVDQAAFTDRPPNVVIESQGDLVLRNGRAKIKLGADGEIEIVCNGFAARSERLLRLLAPIIKLN